MSTKKIDTPNQDPASLDGMNWKQRLTLARVRRGLKKSELASLAGVSGPTVTDWEGQKTKMIDGANLVKVASILHVTPEWIIDGRPAVDPDDAQVIQRFIWAYRNATEVGRTWLRNTLDAVCQMHVKAGEENVFSLKKQDRDNSPW